MEVARAPATFHIIHQNESCFFTSDLEARDFLVIKHLCDTIFSGLLAFGDEASSLMLHMLQAVDVSLQVGVSHSSSVAMVGLTRACVLFVYSLWNRCGDFCKETPVLKMPALSRLRCACAILYL